MISHANPNEHLPVWGDIYRASSQQTQQSSVIVGSKVRFICEERWSPPSAGAVIILHFLCDAASVADSENTLVGGLSMKTHVSDLMVGHGSAPNDIKVFPSEGGAGVNFPKRTHAVGRVSTVGVQPRATVAFTLGLIINTEQRGATAKRKTENKRHSLPVLRWLLGFPSRNQTGKNTISGSDLGCLRTRVVFQL